MTKEIEFEVFMRPIIRTDLIRNYEDKIVVVELDAFTQITIQRVDKK